MLFDLALKHCCVHNLISNSKLAITNTVRFVHTRPLPLPSPTTWRCPFPAPVRAHAKGGGDFSRLKTGAYFSRLKIHHEVFHDLFRRFLHFSHIISWQSGLHHRPSEQPLGNGGKFQAAGDLRDLFIELIHLRISPEHDIPIAKTQPHTGCFVFWSAW